MIICLSQYSQYIVFLAPSNLLSILSLIDAFSSKKTPAYQKKGNANGAIWTGGCGGGGSAGCGASGASCGGGGGGCCG